MLAHLLPSLCLLAYPTAVDQQQEAHKLSTTDLQVPDVASVLARDPHSTELDNRLVRFRMLVQETLEPEIFVGAVRRGGSWQTSKYRDTLDCSEVSEEAYWQRMPLRVVPLAGRSHWCHDSDPTCASGTATPRFSRTCTS